MSAPDCMDTGVYAIEHIGSGRMYIGSAVNFASRWRVHEHHLNKQTHHNKHLQSAWVKHGSAAFVFKKLLVCAKADLISYEQLLIDGYDVTDRTIGYNAAPEAGSMLGYRHTAASKAKMSEQRKNQVFSAETRALWSKNRTGRKMPEWFGEFTRQHRTGAKHTDAVKAYIGAMQVGKKRPLKTIERRSKVSLAQVETIKSRAAAGATQTQLATEFSLSQSAISLIVRGKRWATFTNLKGDIKC